MPPSITRQYARLVSEWIAGNPKRTSRLASSDRSMEAMIRNMTQLVRIAGDVDCNDLVVLDLQRGGLQR